MGLIPCTLCVQQPSLGVHAWGVCLQRMSFWPVSRDKKTTFYFKYEYSLVHINFSLKRLIQTGLFFDLAVFDFWYILFFTFIFVNLNWGSSQKSSVGLAKVSCHKCIHALVKHCCIVL